MGFNYNMQSGLKSIDAYKMKELVEAFFTINSLHYEAFTDLGYKLTIDKNKIVLTLGFSRRLPTKTDQSSDLDDEDDE